MNFLKDLKKKQIVTSILQIAQKGKNKIKEQLGSEEPAQHSNHETIKPAQNDSKRIWKVAEQTSQNFYHEVTSEDALQFVMNLTKFRQLSDKQEKKRLKQLKASFFSELSIEPIYMLENTQDKTFLMELQTNFQEMIQRSSYLVLQKEAIERAIEQLLLSYQLWDIKDPESSSLFSIFAGIIANNLSDLDQLYQRLSQKQKELKRISNHIIKCQRIIKQRVIIKKKISLLRHLKSQSLYNSAASIKFEDIDQAFYVERSRQKLYKKLISTPSLFSKVKLFQDIHNKIITRNKEQILICEKYLKIWALSLQCQNSFMIAEPYYDQPAPNKLLKKHIEKLLILIYFATYEEMYIKNKLSIDYVKAVGRANIGELIGEVNKIKGWRSEEFKYINSSEIKSKIMEFINGLTVELKKAQNKSEKSRRGIFVQKQRTLIQY